MPNSNSYPRPYYKENYDRDYITTLERVYTVRIHDENLEPSIFESVDNDAVTCLGPVGECRAVKLTS